MLDICHLFLQVGVNFKLRGRVNRLLGLIDQ